MESYRTRPVAVLGGGVLGRRIAACWASAGYNVNVRDPSTEQGAAAVQYVRDNVHAFPAANGNIAGLGTVTAYTDLDLAVKDAWLVVEAIPERIGLKMAAFAHLETAAPTDAVLATNSSSYRSSELLAGVQHDATKARILNTHYFMPPDNMVVEIMTDGYTDPKIIAFMVERHREAGMLPYVARKESTGFIFNRLWAAVKRETLTILAEGVATPEEIDSLWLHMFAKRAVGPCRIMDEVGLDTVALIESHYVHERRLSPEFTVDFLHRNYLDHGRLGTKSAKGGLYPRVPRLLVLDIGLAAAEEPLTAGAVLEVSGDGKSRKVLVASQKLPDGIDFDAAAGRFFWTCMGVPGADDGEVHSAKLDGTDVTRILPAGVLNTPKQLTVEPVSKKLYICDREGMRVVRCNYDGSGLEILVQNGDWHVEGTREQDKWCVGITVAARLGRFYWTQKGPSKGGRGRIFSAQIETPTGDVTPSNRPDVHLVLDQLPEPIDLEIDENSSTLYWTDRGELPRGNTLNSAKIDAASGMVLPADGKSHKILSRHFSEAIGLRLDVEAGCLYVTDLSGTIYRCSLDGKSKDRVFSDDECAFTGIAVL